MKYYFDHDVISSFKEYFEYKLLTKGEAFKNKATPLFLVEDDPKLSNNYVVYSAPYAQWVHTTDVVGVTTPTITDGATVLPRGSGGMRVDFKNGRTIFNSGFMPTGTLSGSYSIKEFNTYIATQPYNDLFFERKFQNLPDLQNEAAQAGDKLIAPCIVFRVINTNNDPFCLGGLDKTNLKIRAMVVANSIYSLYGVFGIARDLKETVFPRLGADELPLNEFYDYKTGSGWSYSSVRDANDVQANKMYIFDVRAFPYYEDTLTENYPRLSFGVIDFDIAAFRYPRA